MILHEPTLSLMLALSGAASAAVFAGVAFYAPRIAGPPFWAASSAATAIAFGTSVPAIADWRIASLLFNIPFTISACLLLAGTVRFFGRREHNGLLLLLVALSVAGTVVFSYSWPNTTARVGVLTSVTVLAYIGVAAAALTMPKGPGRLPAVLFALTLVAEAIVSVFRALVVVTTSIQLHYGTPEIAFLNSLAWAIYLLTVIVNAPLLVFLVATRLLADLGAQKERAEAGEAQLRQYARQLDTAEETARRNTAADLHDGVGQTLAGLGLMLGALRLRLNASPLIRLVDEAINASREAQVSINAMIQDISPPELESSSLTDVLAKLALLFERRYRFEVVYAVVDEYAVPRDQIRLIYRVVRELLFNAYKHSKRTRAVVEIRGSAEAIFINVADDGVGFETAAAPRTSDYRRFGLAQLRERVRTAGGVVHVDSAAGEGCRVTVSLPFSVKAA